MSKERYQAFYEQYQTQLPIFAYPWYLDAVCTDGIWDAAIVEEKGKILAVLPYFLKRKYGFRYITMPIFTKFMGPYFAENPTLSEQHDLLEKLIIQLPKVDAFSQNFYYNITNWLPFYWQDYQQMTRYSYQIDLTDLDKVYNNINRSRRRYITKAKELDLKIIHSNDIELFYRINKMSFDRQKLQLPYTFKQLQIHDEALAAHDARQLFFVQDAQGQTHSVAYLIWDAQSGYSHMAGDHPDLRNSGAGTLLMWERIRYTKEKLGLNNFDFEGSMIQNIEYVFRQMGAAQTPYFQVWKYNSRLYKFLQSR
jgi:hypothetical protein